MAIARRQKPTRHHGRARVEVRAAVRLHEGLWRIVALGADLGVNRVSYGTPPVGGPSGEALMSFTARSNATHAITFEE
jgi:hypothetical protein